MKRRKCLVTVALFLFALATVQLPLLAQDNTGSIRGMVYRDINNNGTCATEGEPSVAGIPVELVDDTTRTIVRLQTGADGSYILSEAALGGWQVTVVPGTGWRVTSQQTRAVILTPEVRDVIDVHFCIVEINSPPGGTTLPCRTCEPRPARSARSTCRASCPSSVWSACVRRPSSSTPRGRRNPAGTRRSSHEV